MLAAVLATCPKLIFMDEPLAGLNQEETQFFVELILRLHGEMGIGFVVVEHKIRALSTLSDRLMVMHFGRCICLDTPEKAIRNEQVIAVYLGADFVA
jgi:branched-chain amino acid transport system ATP-binding protein